VLPVRTPITVAQTASIEAARSRQESNRPWKMQLVLKYGSASGTQKVMDEVELEISEVGSPSCPIVLQP